MPTLENAENATNSEIQAPGTGDLFEINNNELPRLFSRNEWVKLFNEGAFKALSDDFFRVFQHFATSVYCTLPAKIKASLNDFVETFLFLFCHPDFKIPDDYANIFINHHMIIANVVAMSDFGTTTPWVYRLMMRNDSFVKLLTLHNVRSCAPIDPARIFDVDALLASKWWTYYWHSAPCFCTKELHARIREHLLSLDDRFMTFGPELRASYFPVTYAAPDLEKVVKGRICKLTTEAFANVVVRNKPSRDKIGLVTGKWYQGAVYTSVSPLIKSLSGHYDLTLIHNGTEEKDICDRTMFDRLICIKLQNGQMDLQDLQDNEFCALIYPDIGMSHESVYLANIRIAPVQVTMYGHPTSSWSSQVDYFVVGRNVEVLENAETNYSERLVAIPGLGVYPVYPENIEVPPAEPVSEEPMVINCAWGSQKVTWPLVSALQDILRKAKRPVVFRMFPIDLALSNARIPFVKDVDSVLGKENVEVMHAVPQPEYLAMLRKGSFSIDAYPFGGFNTIIEALSCKKPVVAWQGYRAFNRFTAATLDMIGMPELIAHSHDEYVEIVSRLINDDDFRRQEIAKVSAIDLKSAFVKEENPEYFLKAIDYLIDNNDRLKAEGSKKPIVIE